MTIGERIKELRAEADLRQSEFGKAIGFSAQVVSNVERGYSFPSTEFVNRSAACFGVPADYILGRTTSRYAVADPKEVSSADKNKSPFGSVADEPSGPDQKINADRGNLL